MNFIADKKIIKINNSEQVFYFDDNNTIWNDKLNRVGFYKKDRIIFYEDVKKSLNKILKK